MLIPPPTHFLHNPYVLDARYLYEEYHHLLNEQEQLGSDNFLCEKVSKSMTNIST